jgi:Rhodopirellula transposase DDE domain
VPELEQNFAQIIENETAGDPMRDQVKWTHRTLSWLSAALEKLGTPVCAGVVKQLLARHDFVKRKMQKSRTRTTVKNRNQQFEKIAALKAQYAAAGNPIFSIDTKKKELLGDLARAGKVYATQAIATLDHDYPSWATGRVVPHGIYDVLNNRGHVNLGLSCDTATFACDSFARYWSRHGRHAYPQATCMLWLCDGGGSNSSSHYVFKEALQKLADRLQLSIRVAHYPPYCSKYNPIEHRLFCHLTRAWQGVVFHSLEIVRRLARQTRTNTGLRVTVDVIKKAYQTGQKVARDFPRTMRIAFDQEMPKWNYTAIPDTKPQIAELFNG